MNERAHRAPARYRIQVLGRIEEEWSDWLGGLAISSERGISTLAGPLPDQAALYGVLDRIRDLGLTLLSLQRLEGGEGM